MDVRGKREIRCEHVADAICEKVPERVDVNCKNIGSECNEACLKGWIGCAAKKMKMRLIINLTARTPFKSIIFADSFAKALDTKRKGFMYEFEVFCS